MHDTGPISGAAGWFVVGGQFTGDVISGNGAVSYTMPEAGPDDFLFA